MGMVNFYHHFTPGIAAVLEPLTAALKGGKKTLEWSPALDNAFQHRKQVLAATVRTPRTQRRHRPGNGRIRHTHRRPTTTTGTGVLGNRWVSFLASYSLQNQNTQRLTGNSSPPSQP
jgi:hypothetical protein